MPTDKYEFDVVYRGAWHRLANLSAHLEHKVPQGHNLLIDRRYRLIVVPATEVHFPCNPVVWPAQPSLKRESRQPTTRRGVVEDLRRE